MAISIPSNTAKLPTQPITAKGKNRYSFFLRSRVQQLSIIQTTFLSILENQH